MPKDKMTYKTYHVETRALDNELVFEAVISTGARDRDGEIVMPDGVDVSNYMRNPVVLFAHDYRSPPVAKTESIWREDNALVARFRFPPPGTYEFADNIRKLWAAGFLNAVSVGFIPLERDGDKITKWELLEFSIVPVPANQEALRRIYDPDVADIKRAIPYKRTPLAPEDAPWDAAREVREADVDDLMVMCAWYDAENPDIKSSYKLPHHRAAAPHECVWRAVVAAMAALFGARGGVQIPDEDRRAVYNHLARHYEDFGKEPPEFEKLADLEADGNLEDIAKLTGADVEPIADDDDLPDDVLDALKGVVEILAAYLLGAEHE